VNVFFGVLEKKFPPQISGYLSMGEAELYFYPLRFLADPPNQGDIRQIKAHIFINTRLPRSPIRKRGPEEAVVQSLIH
jgi:hypothetical protein